MVSGLTLHRIYRQRLDPVRVDFVSVYRNTRLSQVIQDLHGIMCTVFGWKNQIGGSIAPDKDNRPAMRNASLCTERMVMTMIPGAQITIRTC